MWDMFSGETNNLAIINDDHMASIGFGIDGRVVAAENSSPKDVRLRDASTGREVIHLLNTSGTPDSVSLSGNGRYAITGGPDFFAWLWDLQTAKEVKRFPSPHGAQSVGLSNDGRWALIASNTSIGPALDIWDTSSQTKIQHFENIPQLTGGPYAISGDGQKLIAGESDHSVSVWDIQTQRRIQRFGGHSAVNDATFWPDGSYAITSSDDGMMSLWEVKTGVEISTLASFTDGRWATTAGDGHFDATGLENSIPLQWIVSDDPFHPLPLDIFMRDYYEPRLLPRLLACHAAEATDPKACETAFPKVRPLGELNRVQPEVKILGVKRGSSADEAVVEVEALGKTDPTEPNKKTHTEAYDLRLFRDGELVGQWPEPKGATNGPEEIEAWRKASQVPTARHSFPVKLPSSDLSKPVVFTAYAFNEDRVKSETAQADPYKLPADIVKRKPRAYVITVGVNHYKTPRWELEFAAKDAEDMSAALRHLQGYEVVPVTLVSETSATDGVVDQATKANIQAVLRVLATGRHEELGGIAHTNELARATPDDVVILSFSGHGYTEKDGAFYLLPSDANPDEKIPPTSVPSFISSEELSEWLRNVDAGQMAMIIDACHSAASVDVPGFKPGPMGDRGLGQLAYDKGMRILAASQADDIALEIESLHQGLLTYALREGLIAGKDGKLPAADDNGQVTLEAWFKYGEQRTPSLYQDIRDGKIKAVAYQTNPGNTAKARDPKPNPAFLNQAQKRAQTPSLFNFQKQNQDVVLMAPRQSPTITIGKDPS